MKATDIYREDPTGEFSARPGHHLMYLLFQLMQQRSIQMDRLESPRGMSLAKFHSLFFVNQLGECTMGELSQLSGIDRTTLTRTVDNHVAEGLIERRNSETDRRQVLLRLTTKGQDVFSDVAVKRAAYNEATTNEIDDADLRVTCRTLEAILKNTVADDDLFQRIAAAVRTRANLAKST